MFKGRSPVGTIHCRFANSPAFMGSFVNENCCIVGGTEGGGSMYGRVMTGRERMYVIVYVSYVTCTDVYTSMGWLRFMVLLMYKTANNKNSFTWKA